MHIKLFTEKSVRRSLLERPTRRRLDNTRNKQYVFEDVDSFHLAEGRFQWWAVV